MRLLRSDVAGVTSLLLLSGTLVGLVDARADPSTFVPQTFGDAAAFYALGGKADGLPHPLSSMTEFRGHKTAGYTLAQWQAQFAGYVDQAGRSPVTSLKDEIDEVAVQALINTQGRVQTGNELITLPNGMLRFTHAVRSGCYHIQVRGAGRNATTLVLLSPGEDLWHHGTADSPCPSRNGFGVHFEISDLSVTAADLGNRAFDIVQGTDSRVVFDRLYVLGGQYKSGSSDAKGSGTFFLNGVRCQSCSNIISADTYIVGAFGNFGAIAGTGLELTGGATGSMYWHGGFIGGFHTCVLSYTGAVARPLPTAQNGDNEGLVFDGMQSTGCDDVYKTSFDGTPPAAVPEYYIKNGQYGTTARHFIDWDGTSEAFVQHNLIYANNPFGIGGGTFTAGDKTVRGVTYLALPKPGEIVTALFAGLPVGTTIVSIDPGAATLVLSSPPTKSTGENAEMSFEPTQAFTATAKSGDHVLTGISGFETDSNGYLIVQKDGCVYGVPGIAGCDSIVSVDGFNMTVTLMSAPTSSGRISGSFHYPESPSSLYRIRNGVDLHIEDQDVQMPPGNRIGTILDIADSRNVHIKDNDVNDLGNVLTEIFHDHGGNRNLIETDDFFGASANKAFVPVAGPYASNDASVRWGSYYKGLGCDLGSSGKITCAGSKASTLNASARTDALALPPAFLKQPLVMSSNGDPTMNKMFCGSAGKPIHVKAGKASQPLPGAWTFVAACPNGVAGSNVVISYTATGF